MTKFEGELADLDRRLFGMAEDTRTLLRLAVAAIRHRREDVGDEARTIEQRLAGAQSEIDLAAVRMMTTYGPDAGSLRYLLGCMNLTEQRAHICEQTIHICDSLRMMTSNPLLHVTHAAVTQMTDEVVNIVNDSIDAYAMRDSMKAEATRQKTEIVDALNDQVVTELLTDQVLKDIAVGNGVAGDPCTQVLQARHLQRIADRAVNICNEVIHMMRSDLPAGKIEC